MEDVTGAEHTQAQRVCKDFGIKNIEEYHDLYVHSNALVLADAFENVPNVCIEMYELDLTKFISAAGLAWEAALRKTKVKLGLLTGINMLLMVKMV